MQDLRQARLACGMSLESAARHAGITRSHLSRLERGQCPTSPAIVERLAEVYRSDHADRVKASHRLDSLDAHAQAVADSLPPLTDEQRARLAALLAPFLTPAGKTDGLPRAAQHDGRPSRHERAHRRGQWHARDRSAPSRTDTATGTPQTRRRQAPVTDGHRTRRLDG